jgi:hypothetical protein
MKIPVKSALLVLAGAPVGLLAWNTDIYGYLALPLLPYIWSRTSSRLQALLAVYAYYLAAAWCQIPSISTFWKPLDGSPAIGAALSVWFGANLLLSLVWAGFWGQKWQPLRLLGIYLVISFPPIGVIGWASPLTGAGIMFPWMGWYGLALFFALQAVLVSRRGVLRVIPASIILAGALYAYFYLPPSPSADGWAGINTNFGPISDFGGEYGRMMQVDQLARNKIRAGRASNIVFPEAIGGNWPISKYLFSPLDRAAARRHVTIFIGAREYTSSGQVVNAVYSIGQYSGRRWINRVPVPAGLWKPWASTGSAVSEWWDNGVQPVGQIKVGSLVCYEQILVWPALFSAAAGADVLIAPSSTWFGDGSPLPDIKAAASQSWGRLFGIPVISAVNS